LSQYKSLNRDIQEKIAKRIGDKFLLGDDSIRRDMSHDKANLWRPAYVRDAEKIMHCPYYNRYGDKTQVFSLYKNDDITRRALHVQLVSRIARNIGRMLMLNTDLIEAIALGHDIGHTPFGHAGEKYLDRLSYNNTGRHFCHNVHSIRVLDEIFKYNISLQTLDGILCHNGENEMATYIPWNTDNFTKFDDMYNKCYTDKDFANSIMPSTLEGCVVRVSDLIAYIGKDRQDAMKTGLISGYEEFSSFSIGNFNAAIINNMIVNIIENSFEKNYIAMDEECFQSLKNSKKENYELIYCSRSVASIQEEMIAPMFDDLYKKLKADLETKNHNSPVFNHHIEFINKYRQYYTADDYANEEPLQIIIDYIAGMTDDYLVELYDYFFPGKSKIKYFAYFDN